MIKNYIIVGLLVVLLATSYHYSNLNALTYEPSIDLALSREDRVLEVLHVISLGSKNATKYLENKSSMHFQQQLGLITSNTERRVPEPTIWSWYYAENRITIVFDSNLNDGKILLYKYEFDFNEGTDVLASLSTEFLYEGSVRDE